MRPALVLGGVLVTVVVAALVHAQPGGGSAGPKEKKILYVARVKDGGAEVRCGPSPTFYVTNRLFAGNLVEVVEEKAADGDKDRWLAVRPPSGSFSWINNHLVGRISDAEPTYVVHSEAPVLIGSSVVNDKPSVIGARVPRGSQVVAVGQKTDAHDGTGFWLPIQPPPDEVRYVRADQVEKTETAAGLMPVAGTVAEPPPPAPAAPPPGLSGFQLKWYQAEQAEKAGQHTEAMRLYDEVRKETRNTAHHDVAIQCDNRICNLQSRVRGGAPVRPASRVFTPTGIATAAQARLFPLPVSSSGQPAPCIPCPLPAPVPTQQTAYGSPPPLAATDCRAGWLRLSGCPVDGQRAYVLECHSDRFYVTPQPGVDLERFLNQAVELSGPVRYRGELRAYHMTAVRVAPQ